MSKSTEFSKGRYILYLDILGFSDLVKSKGAELVYETINNALMAFDHWDKLNGQFQTLYFSDTFIFYQVPEGYGDWAFLDVYAIGSMLLSALLAKEIPARGVISFGQFNVQVDESEKHQTFFGGALIDAYQAEKKENWIGISILKSAWLPYEERNPGNIEIFQGEHVWLKRDDGILLLNPLQRICVWYGDYLIGEIRKPYFNWDVPEFPNDIFALKFLCDRTAAYKKAGDFSSRKATKYYSTMAFLEQVLGEEIFKWGLELTKEIEKSKGVDKSP